MTPTVCITHPLNLSQWQWSHDKPHSIPLKYPCIIGGTEQTLSTSAISGFISTPGYNKPFNMTAFINPNISHSYKIILDFSGISIPENGGVELNLKIDKNLHRKEAIFLCDQPLASQEINLKISYMKSISLGNLPKIILKKTWS